MTTWKCCEQNRFWCRFFIISVFYWYFTQKFRTVKIFVCYTHICLLFYFIRISVDLILDSYNLIASTRWSDMRFRVHVHEHKVAHPLSILIAEVEGVWISTYNWNPWNWKLSEWWIQSNSKLLWLKWVDYQSESLLFGTAKRLSGGVKKSFEVRYRSEIIKKRQWIQIPC